MKISEEKLKELKGTIDCHKVLGVMPQFNQGKLKGLKCIDNSHIAYLKQLVGRKLFEKLDWRQKFHLIEHMKE